VTQDNDFVITPLIGNPRANFIKLHIDGDVQDLDITGHLLTGTYLNQNVVGRFGTDTSQTSTRKVVATLFNEVYNSTVTKYPCIDSAKSTPNPVGINEPTVFSAMVISRTGQPVTDGSVTFTDGDRTVCTTTTVAADGKHSCEPVTFTTQASGKTIKAQWSNQVFRSQVEEFTFNADSSYWFGTFTPTSCPVAPNGMEWFWEGSCGNIGFLDGQNPANFWFPAAGGNVTMQVDSYSGMRKVFNVEWNAADLPVLRLSMPNEVLVPSSSGDHFVRYSGTRLIELTVGQRSAVEISGTFVVTSVAGAHAPHAPPNSPGNIAAPIETRSTGTWSARLLAGPMPITNMNGFDLCYRDGGATNYRNLDSMVFTPGNGNWYTSLGTGSSAGTCVYGK
jgi:hypothetical protein